MNKNKGNEMTMKAEDKKVVITWNPMMVRVDDNDPSKGHKFSETQLEIVAKGSSRNAVYGKRTRYTGDISKVNEIIARYAKRGYKEV